MDPLRHAKIRREVNGNVFMGHVEEIEQGKVTKERALAVTGVRTRFRGCFLLFLVCDGCIRGLHFCLNSGLYRIKYEDGDLVAWLMC